MLFLDKRITIFKILYLSSRQVYSIMKETKKNGHGGRRPGSGRPRNDSRLYAFRAGGVVADYIDAQDNKTSFIVECIRERMREEEPDIARVGEVWSATQVEPLLMHAFDQRVVAGFPIPLNNDERSQKINVLKMLCPYPEATYLIRVEGDSMIDSNIFSGDILVVDKSNRNPSENEVAMCELNGEYTVKFVRRHDRRCWLVPANKEYPEIEITEDDDFNVWGVITYVIHRPQPV